uniref:RRM domain-containing protein n=1 Tax=Ditylenchus dipsaci TaxID=166011 RepID=A0A915DPG6_9BILA
MRPLLRLLPYLLPSTSRLCIIHQFQVNARVLAQYRCLNVSAAVYMPVSNINLLHDWKSNVRFRHMFRVEQLPSAATEQTLREFYSHKEALHRALEARPHSILGQSVIARDARLRHLILEGLSSETTEESLTAFYVQFGCLVGTVVLNGAEPGSKIGYVYFGDEENMNSAISALPHVIDGKEVEVKILYPSELTLCVTKLSLTTTDAKLKEVFSKFDPMVKCNVKMDSKTGKSSGIAYLRFSSEQELQAALDAQPYVIDGEQIEVIYKNAQHELFLPALPYSITEESLKNFFSTFDPNVNCHMAREKETNRLRDFATVTFSSKEALENAIKARPYIIEGMKVNALNDGVRRSKRCAIFVGGLAYKTTDETLRNFFADFGTVVEATIKRDKETNRSRGFGFVTFSTVKAAQIALANEPYN